MRISIPATTSATGEPQPDASGKYVRWFRDGDIVHYQWQADSDPDRAVPPYGGRVTPE